MANVDQTKIHKGESMQFSSDDVARIVSSVFTQVFDALSIQQIVEGTAVIPAGDSTYLVDIVMRDRLTNKLRDVAINRDGAFASSQID